jgi:hypothetical protein
MENQQATNETAVAHPELGIADLQNLRSIIEVAVRRGVFVASELSSVGSVYDRLNAFLNAVAPAGDLAQQDAN